MLTPSALDLDAIEALQEIYLSQWSDVVQKALYTPTSDHFRLDDGCRLIENEAPALAGALLPLAAVDESSLACVALVELDTQLGRIAPGSVVRLLLADVPERYQLALVDVDPLSYVTSLQEELAARDPGLARVLDEIGPAYDEAYIANAKRPRDFIVRPVRLACQNVIVALAAFAQDSTFDGLSVTAWQTCEVPHLATHEANRALAALTLCEAFARGGTMEIRFDRPASVGLAGRTFAYSGHPEGRVPASLRRFGRSVGVALGSDDSAAVSPREARKLFLAVTPMPVDLRARVRDATTHQGLSPEQACYSLLSQVWREVELDVLLSTSQHAASILSGGADWTNRTQRQAEADACRAALMTGMYYRRLCGRDNAAADGDARLAEDVSGGVAWTVNDADATVTFHLSEAATPAWTEQVGDIKPTAEFLIAPRVHVSDRDQELVRASWTQGVAAALLVPRDTILPPVDVPVLRCPDRLDDLDRTVEEKLLSSRISRA
jgi:hypothetical protein